MVFFLVFISGYPLVSFFKHLVLPFIISCVIFSSLLLLPSINTFDKLLPRLTTWKNRLVDLAVEKELIVIREAGKNGKNLEALAEEFNINGYKILKWNYFSITEAEFASGSHKESKQIRESANMQISK